MVTRQRTRPARLDAGYLASLPRLGSLGHAARPARTPHASDHAEAHRVLEAHQVDLTESEPSEALGPQQLEGAEEHVAACAAEGKRKVNHQASLKHWAI